MKKHYLLFIAALLSGLVNQAFAQTYTSPSGNLVVTVAYDTASHDSTSCNSRHQINYLVTKYGSFAGDSILLVDTIGGVLIESDSNTSGSSTWISSSFYLASYIYDYQVTGGYAYFGWPDCKFVSGTDTVYLPQYNHNDSLYVPNPCQYSTISGRLYADLNGNCTYDTGEYWLGGVWPSNDEVLSSGTGYGFNGYINYMGGYADYTILAQQSWLSTGTVSIDSSYSFIFPSTCFIGPYTYTTLPQTNVDFPLQCSGNLDVQCWMGNPGRARPARPLFLQPYVSNLGCDAVSGVLTLVKDPRVSYDSALSSYPADYVSGDTLQWNYYGLTSLSSGYYWNSFMSDLHMTPDSSVTIGDTLCFHIYTGIPSADINPANNDFNICIPVVTSYDPNEKDVEPKGDGADGEIPSITGELTYTLHFQNTGSADAIDIHITDTLDSHIDASSLKVLGASHLMNPRWRAPNVIDFQFPGIMLPDSNSNEPASHGYVRFKVKLNSGLPVGTQIKNKGYIYFDTNPAVITNEAISTLVHNTSIAAVPVRQVKVYPNPAADNITVENLQDGELSIMSMDGTVVLQQHIAGMKTDVNIGRLPVGVYILRTISKNGTTTQKFVKE